jgi:hypothetical protein
MDKVIFEVDAELEQAMLEMREHDAFVEICEVIYKHGLFKTLHRMADYCNDPKEAYALSMLSKMYKENERAICQDAPTMQ